MTIEVTKSKVIAAVVTALVTLASSVTGLLFQLFPDWKPVPREHVTAVLKVRTLDTHVSAGDYSRRLGGADTCYSEPTDPGRTKRIGNVAYLQADTTGFKHRTLSMSCAVYNSKSRRVLKALIPPAGNFVNIRPDTPVDRAVAQVWVPTPSRTGRFFARFELYEKQPDGDYTLLDFADSGNFSGS
jgi:hypothetical protein